MGNAEPMGRLDNPAESYELYTVSMDCERAGKEIDNAVIEAARNTLRRAGTDGPILDVAEEELDRVGEVMADYAEFGAQDTEPEVNTVLRFRELVEDKIGRVDWPSVSDMRWWL